MRTLAFLTIALTTVATGPRAFPQTAADPDANAPAKSPAQNRKPAQLPPPGVAIPEADRSELTAGAAELGKEIAALKLAKIAPDMSALIPDVEIFHKAVDWALRYDEFYDVKQVASARTLLAEGKSRAVSLREGKAPWTTATGLVVRGYRSEVDGSVQPFGVVIPATWKGPGDNTRRAAWIWNHGRNEKLTELAFIADRMKSRGEFTPEDTFVIHPYGRYCNATKFAGETDVFECLQAAGRSYRFTTTVNAGFSMGGASAWHLGAHHPGMWVANHAGAGFAETAEYAGVFANGKTPPPWWEVVLYRWYDATICAANFGITPMLAYHGSEDKQKQATEIMKRFAEKEGVEIEEFVGPGVAHKYEPKTKKEIADKLQAIANSPQRQFPRTSRFVCYTSVYGLDSWGAIAELEREWERAEVSYRWGDDGKLAIQTTNVARFGIIGPTGNAPAYTSVTINGEGVDFDPSRTSVAYLRREGRWISASKLPKSELANSGSRKSLTLCGPIDHAFTNAFIFVKPTGKPLNPALGEWTQRELAHATKQWRGIFRGEAPTVEDTNLTEEQIQSSNIVLWGDPSSNAVLKKFADKLPAKWSKDGLEFGGVKYDASTHMPLLIFPNPLNPERYVVLNSGFTFNRAAASGTNSLQTPKLPDWAIVDTSVPPDDKFPGKIVDAGFFDAQWKFTKERPK